ncbi:unnamed protein product [Moneuplotes crassus]|uniref:Uncharacterized protein n=1 Tax=Euplotes crassus TaxID=5936 RepID=A0AAD1X7A6_EUPCR|nr:unnamed protein product [Moneuplotes crassus]
MKLREERKEQDGRAVVKDLEMKLPPKKPMHLNQLKNTNFLKMYNSKNPIHETDRENKLSVSCNIDLKSKLKISKNPFFSRENIEKDIFPKLGYQRLFELGQISESEMMKKIKESQIKKIKDKLSKYRKNSTKNKATYDQITKSIKNKKFKKISYLLKNCKRSINKHNNISKRKIAGKNRYKYSTSKDRTRMNSQATTKDRLNNSQDSLPSDPKMPLSFSIERNSHVTPSFLSPNHLSIFSTPKPKRSNPKKTHPNPLKTLKKIIANTSIPKSRLKSFSLTLPLSKSPKPLPNLSISPTKTPLFPSTLHASTFDKKLHRWYKNFIREEIGYKYQRIDYIAVGRGMRKLKNKDSYLKRRENELLIL